MDCLSLNLKLCAWMGHAYCDALSLRLSQTKCCCVDLCECDLVFNIFLGGLVSVWGSYECAFKHCSRFRCDNDKASRLTPQTLMTSIVSMCVHVPTAFAVLVTTLCYRVA
jgi:hypothetical protein